MVKGVTLEQVGILVILIINKIYDTENNFKKWLIDEKPMDLNNVLSGWDATSKAAFLNDHLDVLEAGGCLYFTANP